MRATLVAGCAVLLAACPSSATVIHVSPDGSGDYPTIQAAIDAATSGDEIELSDGTFTGVGNWDLNLASKELVLRSVNGYEATILDCGFYDTYEEHRGINVEGGQTAATRIEGLTIQYSAWSGDGGAVRCAGASPVIRNVRIRWCLGSATTRGLGIFVAQAGPIIESCILEENISPPSVGNAIFGLQATPHVSQCSIDSNWGDLGIVHLDGGTLTDCTFHRNTAGDERVGKAVYVVAGSVSILRCLFSHGFNVGVTVSSGAEALVDDCVFEGLGSHGGTAATGDGHATFEGCTFRGNSADITSSVIAWGDGALLLDRCLFVDNLAAGPLGSTIDVWGGSLTLSRCTVASNRANSRASALHASGDATVTIDRTIIAFGQQTVDPEGPISCDETATLEVSCTDVFGNAGGDWVGCLSGMEVANGNLCADPLFCDLVSEDLSLNSESPCAPEHSGGCDLIGALGVACGPTAVETQSWGSIKALYR